nr:extracellular solute-binding protein [Dictyobacter kobayashii]
MGAFGSSFASTIADTNQDTALLYTGKAAMMLQGSWNFPVVQTNSPDFIKNGKLGWFPFPAVEGGKGNIGNVYGNPCNFYSISKTAKSPQSCITYLKDAVLADEEVKQFIAVGDVPPIQGIESQLASAPMVIGCNITIRWCRNRPTSNCPGTRHCCHNQHRYCSRTSINCS